jgi:hypothetical protein
LEIGGGGSYAYWDSNPTYNVCDRIRDMGVADEKVIDFIIMYKDNENNTHVYLTQMEAHQFM